MKSDKGNQSQEQFDSLIEQLSRSKEQFGELIDPLHSLETRRLDLHEVIYRKVHACMSNQTVQTVPDAETERIIVEIMDITNKVSAIETRKTLILNEMYRRAVEACKLSSIR